MTTPIGRRVSGKTIHVVHKVHVGIASNQKVEFETQYGCLGIEDVVNLEPLKKDGFRSYLGNQTYSGGNRKVGGVVMTRLFLGVITLLFLLILFVSSTTPTGKPSHYTAEESKAIPESPQKQYTAEENNAIPESPKKQLEIGFVSLVRDGDSMTIKTATGEREFRLAGIDTPELHQSFGPEAKDYLRSLAPRGTQVSLEITETDKYNRGIAFVRVGDLDLNYAMVTNGLAWSHIKFDRDRRFRKPQREAREAGRGLWVDPKPMPPWDWKEQHPR